MKNRFAQRRNNKGVFMISVLVIMVFIVIFSVVVIQFACMTLYRSSGVRDQLMARLAAESGMDYALMRIQECWNNGQVAWVGAPTTGYQVTSVAAKMDVTEHYVAAKQLGWVEGRLNGNPEAMFFIYFTEPTDASGNPMTTFEKPDIGTITPRFRSINNTTNFDTAVENTMLFNTTVYHDVPQLSADIVVQGYCRSAEKHVETMIVRLPDSKFNFAMKGEGLDVNSNLDDSHWLLRSTVNFPPKLEMAGDVAVDMPNNTKADFIKMRASGSARCKSISNFDGLNPQDYGFITDSTMTANDGKVPDEITRDKMKCDVLGMDLDSTQAQIDAKEKDVLSGSYLLRVESKADLMKMAQEANQMLDTHKTVKESLETQIAENQASITAAQANISSNDTTIASNTAAIAANSSTISSLQTQIAALDPATQQAEIDALNAQITSLQATNSNLQSQNGILSSAIADNQSQISNLQDDITVKTVGKHKRQQQIVTLTNYVDELNNILNNEPGNYVVLMYYYNSDSTNDAPASSNGILFTQGVLMARYYDEGSTFDPASAGLAGTALSKLKQSVSIDFDSNSGVIRAVKVDQPADVTKMAANNFQILVDNSEHSYEIPTVLLGDKTYISNNWGNVSFNGQIGGTGGVFAGNYINETFNTAGSITFSGRNAESVTGNLNLYATKDITVNPDIPYEYTLVSSSATYDADADVYQTSKSVVTRTIANQNHASSGNPAIDTYGLSETYIAMAIVDYVNSHGGAGYQVQYGFSDAIKNQNVTATPRDGGAQITGKLYDLLKNQYHYDDHSIYDRIRKVVRDHSTYSGGHHGTTTISSTDLQELATIAIPPTASTVITIENYNLLNGLLVARGKFLTNMANASIALQGSVFAKDSTINCDNINSIYDPASLRLLYELGNNMFHKGFYVCF